MSLLGLFFVVFVVALPAMGVLSAVRLLSWPSRDPQRMRRSRARALAARSSVPRDSVGFQATRDLRWIGLLDETALFPRARMARYFAAEHKAHTILLRAQPELVNRDGALVGSLVGRDDAQVERVVATWTLLVDAPVPPDLQLLCVLAPTEDVLGDSALAAGLIHGSLLALVGPGDQLVITEGHMGYASPFAFSDRLCRHLVHELLHVASRLESAIQGDGLDVPWLLTDLIDNDPSAEARARAVQALLQYFPEDPRSATARERALRDSSPAVRFACARHLGKEGFDVTEAIVFDNTAAEGLRQRALRHLIRETPRDRMLDLLQRVLLTPEDRIRQIAIRHLGTLEYKPALEWFETMPVISSPELGLELVHALRSIGCARGEDLLRPHLLWKDSTVQIAALEAFGAIGTRRALPPLFHFARHAGNREIRRAAAAAIREIRERHRGAGVGALSMAHHERGGEVSLAPAQHGTLSEHRSWRRRTHRPPEARCAPSRVAASLET